MQMNVSHGIYYGNPLQVLANVKQNSSYKGRRDVWESIELKPTFLSNIVFPNRPDIIFGRFVATEHHSRGSHRNGSSA